MFATTIVILRDCLRWENIRRVLALNTLIAVFLTFMGSPFISRVGIVPTSVTIFFLINLIYSQSIGLTIFFSVTSLIQKYPRPGLGLFFVLLLVITAASAFGTLLASLITSLTGMTDFDLNRELFFLPHNIIAGLFFGSAIVAYFNLKERMARVVKELAEKEVNEQKLLQSKTRAELEALRARINPHFLFNTLNSVASLIPEQPEKAESMVQKLSTLLRYTLDAEHREMIGLGEEIDIVRQYLEIEKVRLGKRLQFDISLPGELESVQIPGLIIQPLVENSIKHGIARKTGGGSISITCARQGGAISISIADTGDGFQEDSPGSDGFGLAGVQERLHLHYGEGHTFDIHSTAQGTRIEIRIPAGKPAVA